MCTGTSNTFIWMRKRNLKGEVNSTFHFIDRFIKIEMVLTTRHATDQKRWICQSPFRHNLERKEKKKHPPALIPFCEPRVPHNKRSHDTRRPAIRFWNATTNSTRNLVKSGEDRGRLPRLFTAWVVPAVPSRWDCAGWCGGNRHP